MAGQLLISGQLTGTPLGTINIGPFTLTGNAASNLQINQITFASGANTIAIPTWAKGMLIEPNTINAVALTLKGITGDTGVTLSPTTPTLVTFPASPQANFVITAGALFTTITSITFF